MVTYFNLRPPEPELLLAENESYRSRVYSHCSITSEHIEGSHRVRPF